MSGIRFDEKIIMGKMMFRSLTNDGQTVPAGSCIAQEIDRIAKKLRVKKAETSYFRVAVYYPVWKINHESKEQKHDSDQMHGHDDDDSSESSDYLE